MLHPGDKYVETLAIRLKKTHTHTNKESARNPENRVIDGNHVEERFPVDNTYRYFSYRSHALEIKGKQQNSENPIFSKIPGGESLHWHFAECRRNFSPYFHWEKKRR